ncbi:BnaC09g14220D [Brassica napus]|uniref:Uncharacterized protein n=2 Tax=Brassica TaxID=3705 RepID=A0A3P6EB34_BRAOL|nr:unnamed protein product [Brassica napus]CDY46982.1 BnaC09g14220D [Brassica napus]VDD29752.1 unnamed protein product [Brassica oleracea]
MMWLLLQRHARLERIMKGESPGRDDVDYDEDGYDLETPPSQKNDECVLMVKAGNKGKLGIDDDPETPSQDGEKSDDSTQNSRKKMRQTKD